MSSLDRKQRGRPLLLGMKLDAMVRNRITAMRERGAFNGTTVVQGIGMGVLLKPR